MSPSGTWSTRGLGSSSPPGDGEVWEELLSLPERERTALYLHYYQGYSTKETAGLMGTKPATLRTWLFRARKKLKERLEADGYGV